MNTSDPSVERAYLAICIDMPEALDAGLTVEHMASGANRAVMAAMLAMRQAAKEINQITLSHELQLRGMERITAIDTVSQILSEGTATLAPCVRVLRELHEARTLVEASSMGLAHAQRGELNEAREVLAKAAFGQVAPLEIFSLRDAMEATAQEYYEAAQSAQANGSAKFFPLGICPTVDRILRVGPGDTIIIGAETNVGKSSISMTCLLSLEHHGIAAGLVSVEDPKVDWGGKAIGHYSGEDTAPFWAGTATPEQWSRLLSALPAAAARKQLARFAVAKSGTIDEVCQAMNALVRVHGARILFVDYIQAISSGLKGANPKQEIDHVYRRIQTTARLLEVPVVIGSQLSRGPTDTAAEPGKKRLKESGNLENGAQVILLFWVRKEDEAAGRWGRIMGKVEKLKRVPVRPRWCMERGAGGVLTECEMPIEDPIVPKRRGF